MIDRASQLDLTEKALIAGFFVSASLLAGAHLFERVGHLMPCALCLDQREAHWAALAVAGLGLVMGRLTSGRLAAKAAVGAAALVYAVSAGLAFYHVGVEHKFWPGPATCAAAGEIGDVSDIVSSLTRKAEGPACDDIPWTLFGVSMAGYNMLASAALFGLSMIAAIANARDARYGRTPRPEPLATLSEN